MTSEEQPSGASIAKLRPSRMARTESDSPFSTNGPDFFKSNGGDDLFIGGPCVLASVIIVVLGIPKKFVGTDRA